MIFDEAIEFAVHAAAISAKKYANAPNDIVRDAMFAISQDAVITHRAVGTLSRVGWTASSAPLLRTLIDLQISAIAIVESKDSKLAAFRYFYSAYRQLAREGPKFTPELRASARATIRTRINQQFLKEKDRAYWFWEEWQGPVKVLEQFVPALVEPYQRLSAAAHGGFIGVRLFREDSDTRSINPETQGLKAMYARLTSSRLLVDLTAIRSRTEGLDLDARAQELRTLQHIVHKALDEHRYRPGT